MLLELSWALFPKSKFPQPDLDMQTCIMLERLFTTHYMLGTELRRPAPRAHIGCMIFGKLTINSYFNTSHWMAIFF
jgi:hypothetical protein